MKQDESESIEQTESLSVQKVIWTPLSEEAEQVRRASLGDQIALVKLYEHYFDRVYRYFFDRVGSISEAEVLTAETFHLVVNALMSNQCSWQSKVFGSWLYAIANILFEEHNCTTLMDDLKRILERNEPVIEGEDVLDLVVRQVEQKMLWQLVYELQALEQEVLIMCHKSKLSYAAMAIRLGYKEEDCKQLHYQALTNLKRKAYLFGVWSGIREENVDEQNKK